ncbi:MAG TPA: APC family permease [Terriglobales bacterium]|nr:APC family permease [Terriglobales bacterium]
MEPTRGTALESRPHGLVRGMGLWDVILFNIAAVVGPRWVASAAHTGPNSIGLWLTAAALFFLPTALVITELATRYPHVGGVYAWTQEAFGPFHGFVSGWVYWTYSIVYFPALLNASVAMAAYMGGPKMAALATNKPFVICGSLLILGLAIWMNIVGVKIGKWLENAGAIGTYVPLTVLVLFGAWFAARFGSATHIGVSDLKLHVNWGTINYWSQIAFAFSGLEVVCFMSEEVHDPQRTLKRGILVAAAAIVAIYVLGTVGTLAILHPGQVDVRAGAIQALTSAAGQFGLAWIAIVIAVLLAIGNVGGVGTTVAGVARVPFAAGIDRYLPRAFGKIHPTWRTPWVAMLVQGLAAAVLLIVSQIGGADAVSAYQLLVDATDVMYFIAFIYMFLAVIKLRNRPDRGTQPGHALVPLGQFGVWTCGLLGLSITLLAIAISFIPPADLGGSSLVFEIKLVVICGVLILSGLVLYWRKGKRGDAPLSPLV